MVCWAGSTASTLFSLVCSKPTSPAAELPLLLLLLVLLLAFPAAAVELDEALPEAVLMGQTKLAVL
jgi:hypothetical protein